MECIHLCTYEACSNIHRNYRWTFIQAKESDVRLFKPSPSMTYQVDSRKHRINRFVYFASEHFLCSSGFRIKHFQHKLFITYREFIRCNWVEVKKWSNQEIATKISNYFQYQDVVSFSLSLKYTAWHVRCVRRRLKVLWYQIGFGSFFGGGNVTQCIW